MSKSRVNESKTARSASICSEYTGSVLLDHAPMGRKSNGFSHQCRNPQRRNLSGRSPTYSSISPQRRSGWLRPRSLNSVNCVPVTKHPKKNFIEWRSPREVFWRTTPIEPEPLQSSRFVPNANITPLAIDFPVP